MSGIDDVIKNLKMNMDKYDKSLLELAKSEIHVESGNARDSLVVKKKSEYEHSITYDSNKLKSDSRNKSKTDYMPIYYFGRKAIDLRGSSRVMVFTKNGRTVRTKYVKGTKGDPFFHRVVENRPKFGG